MLRSFAWSVILYIVAFTEHKFLEFVKDSGILEKCGQCIDFENIETISHIRWENML